ncbi:hypothetical protein CBER1_11044 [Cercospora berteroae]|uniref:F-box domain-containing protein n=1 Tax=Cercospora berteroae TaxID=357750 RepID=A0A2S6BYN8_9PEZI|nr:hypothetical protein CBER1_11044 [Cercospora berteroae]
MSGGGIARLPTELVERILSFVEPGHHEREVDIAQRRHLSVESFEPAPAPSRSSVADVGRFRSVCKRFAQIGEPLLFTRVAIRFSEDGLKRLEQLAEWSHLAAQVRRFTYLVPYFYEDDAHDLDSLTEELQQFGLGKSEIGNLRRKETEQRTICTRKDDVRILKRAIASFTRLELVQLLRVSDREDGIVLNYLRRHEDARRRLNLSWNAACSHASRTIITALLTSNEVPWSRFSLPILSPDSARFLRLQVPNSVSTLAERLEVLTLHFDDNEDLDAKIQELSVVFKEVFTKARNMKAVHVGFPSHRPLTLPLESIFHYVKWEKLVAFGVQGWELDESEIIGLAKRHPNLKGLRLRDVHLKQGSLWKDILGFLRSDMLALQWVSLRRIGYTAYYHSQQFTQDLGTELPDYPLGDLESSSDEDTDDEDVPPLAGPSNTDQTDSDDSTESQFDEDSDLDSDDEHGPEAHEVDFPALHSPDTPGSAPWCTCSGGGGRLESADQLDDDGLRVDNTKRKYWEKWVLRRCPEHGER